MFIRQIGRQRYDLQIYTLPSSSIKKIIENE